jgi:SAM-dependent methyltransferase
MKRSSIDLMRPKVAYERVIKQRKIDGKSFFQRYNKNFVKICCPACGGNGQDTFKKNGFRHKICNNCKTLYCSPRPTEDLLMIFYNDWDSPRMWTEVLLKSDKERKFLQYQPRIAKIVSLMKKNHTKGGGVAVDLGAGSGAFALCLQKTKFFADVIALDLSEACVNACKNAGLNAQLKTINAMPDDSIDLICLNDLIEHLFDPYSFLLECYRTLREDGYISIATPNGVGFDFKIMKDRTVNITPPEHIQYFNPDSLELILRRAGFNTIFLETPGELDVQMVLQEKSRGFAIDDRNEFIAYLLEQDDKILNRFQKFLSESGLSSHMLCLAQK